MVKKIIKISYIYIYSLKDQIKVALLENPTGENNFN